jgi:hypothetical protein|tara:strand:- start:2992 stop:3600 length:609 start_codon:yes stop_codon:yes gene_type:complete
MDEKYLLTEYVNLQYSRDTIKEAVESNNPIVLKGLMQKAGALNANKRIYPKEVLAREVNNYMKVVRDNRAVGELDHPNESVVELKNVSHIVKDLWWENDDLHGSVEVLNTPNGKILQSLLESQVTIGVSSRGVGSLKKKGENNVVEDDFVLICWDIVSEPSTDGAYLMKEGKVVNTEDAMQNFTKTDKLDRILNSIIEFEVK